MYTVIAEMGLQLREFDIKPNNVSLNDSTKSHVLLDTDWLQKQYTKRLFVFNILCVGKLGSCFFMFDYVGDYWVIMEMTLLYMLGSYLKLILFLCCLIS